MDTVDYRGVMVPLVTPLDPHGRVCEASVARLIESLRRYASGFAPLLSTGEGWKVGFDRWEEMLAFCRKHAPDRPVVAGITTNTAAEARALASRAKDFGADAIAVGKPRAQAMGATETADFYAEIAASAGLGLMIYNVASASNPAMSVAEIESLFGCGVVAVKESSRDAALTRALCALPGKGAIAVLQGWEDRFLDSGPVDGFIAAVANVAADLVAAVFATRSQCAQQRVFVVCERLSLFEDDWVAHLKTELASRGVLSTAFTL